MGNITPQDVHDFYSKYRDNSLAVEEKTKALFKHGLDMNEWSALLKDCSALSRSVFLENSAEISRVILPFIQNPERLTLELVDAFLEEVTPLAALDNPDYETVEQVLEIILEYMKREHFPALRILETQNSLMLARITEKKAAPSVGSFPGLDPVLRYIDDSTGPEAMVHIQNIILMLTVKRRIHTFAHSVVVSKLATLIARKIMADIPDFFGNLGESSSDILGFVNTAALLHDVGKSDIAHVINTQNRELTEQEFEVIRRHPEIGGKLLDSIPSLSIFSDVARGHHRYFDGSGGYPMEFDNLKSKLKAVIDLVAVCDSIDAGTDSLTRSYSESKNLRAILDELVDGQGTRYSPYIVETIISDPMLIDQIENIISVGRENMYYDIYRQHMLDNYIE